MFIISRTSFICRIQPKTINVVRSKRHRKYNLCCIHDNCGYTASSLFEVCIHLQEIHDHSFPGALHEYNELKSKVAHRRDTARSLTSDRHLTKVWEENNPWPGLYNADGKVKCQEGYIDEEFYIGLQTKKEIKARLTGMHKFRTLKLTESVGVLRDHLAVFGDIWHRPRVVDVRYEDMGWRMLCVIAYHYDVEYNRRDEDVSKLANILRASEKIPGRINQSMSVKETAVYPSPWLNSLEVSYVIQFNLHSLIPIQVQKIIYFCRESTSDGDAKLPHEEEVKVRMMRVKLFRDLFCLNCRPGAVYQMLERLPLAGERMYNCKLASTRLDDHIQPGSQGSVSNILWVRPNYTC